MPIWMHAMTAWQMTRNKKSGKRKAKSGNVRGRELNSDAANAVMTMQCQYSLSWRPKKCLSDCERRNVMCTYIFPCHIYIYYVDISLVKERRIFRSRKTLQGNSSMGRRWWTPSASVAYLRRHLLDLGRIGKFGGGTFCSKLTILSETKITFKHNNTTCGCVIGIEAVKKTTKVLFFFNKKLTNRIKMRSFLFNRINIQRALNMKERKSIYIQLAEKG